MTQNFNVLIIDDHPLIIEAYQRALDYLEDKYSYLNFNVSTAKCCDSANEKIEKASEGKPIDLVFLDISLPPSKNGMFTSGEDLGVKLRELFRNVKIIVATRYTNNYRLINILKSFNPEGLMIKTELDFETLAEAIMSIISDCPFYSTTVLRLIRRHISSEIYLDTIDRNLLYQLSLGTKTKDLPEYVHLSLAAIERRKRKLNELFNTEGKSDKQLLKSVKEKGFL